MSVNEIAEARALRENDSTKWAVRDALNAMLRDMDNGELEPECVSIHFFKKSEGGSSLGYYAAGLSYDKHIALLHLALQRCVDDWRK